MFTRRKNNAKESKCCEGTKQKVSLARGQRCDRTNQDSQIVQIVLADLLIKEYFFYDFFCRL
jgi:hypothetical protein